jgi:hypothetical protein
MTHSVVLYFKTTPTKFSITARKPSARLGQVNAQQMRRGFSQNILIEGITKIQAEGLKMRLESALESMNFTKDPRPQLS